MSEGNDEMKVLLAFLPQQCDSHKQRWSNAQPPAAIYLLSSILRSIDIETCVLDPLFFVDKEVIGGTEIISMECFDDVDIVGLSSNSFNWANTKKFIEFIKERRPEIKIVLGGVHPTYLDDYVIRSTSADIAIRGEGEKTITRVVKALRSGKKDALESVLGITYRSSNGQIIRNADAPMLTTEEFNQVIHVDYKEMPNNFYRLLPFESSRGCLFDCSFCGVPFHKSWRPLSLEKVIEKFDYTLDVAYKKMAIPAVVFGDDCFTVDKERVKGIFKHIKSLSGDFYVNLEGRLSDLKDTSIMDDYPMEHMMQFSVGIENGYDEGLKLSKKGYTVKIIDQLFANYKNRPDILGKIQCSFIIGLPWEGVKECIKTIQFAAYLTEEYGVKCSIAWWCIIPSLLWQQREQYNIHVDESLFDQNYWYMPNVETEAERKRFFSYHPKLTMKDREKIDSIINLYYNNGINLTQR
ncbi:B12-binding domain-containing radical SAM protein [Clostridium sp. UBA1652]|uniref:B12-binding domain-containing radical SAM protein n=1 Tax=Clostridium sp. UBA1652 TaxID=1946348 RepID=UPI00257CB572|nr:radical SAM protein [Clostridium sp. UBA1652]